MMDAPNNASSEPHRATTITTMPLQNVSSNFLVVTTTNNNDSSGGGKTAYELERDRKVSENQARMRALGIDAARERIEIANAKKKTSKRSNDIWSKKRKSAVHVASSPRVTRRQRMMSNETEEEREAREAAERTQRELNGYYDDEQKQRTKAMVKTRGLEFPRVKEEFPNSVGMFGPFAMKTAKTNGPVTVLAVGAPATGGRRRFESEFWSRTGCLYHHPYLIGYKAEKVFQLLAQRACRLDVECVQSSEFVSIVAPLTHAPPVGVYSAVRVPTRGELSHPPNRAGRPAGPTTQPPGIRH